MTQPVNSDGGSGSQIKVDLQMAIDLGVYGHRKNVPEAIRLGAELQKVLMAELENVPPSQQLVTASTAPELSAPAILGRITENKWMYRIGTDKPKTLDPGRLLFPEKSEVTVTATAEDPSAKLFIYWRRVGKAAKENDFGSGKGVALGRWKPKGNLWQVDIENVTGPANMLVTIEATISFS